MCISVHHQFSNKAIHRSIKEILEEDRQGKDVSEEIQLMEASTNSRHPTWWNGIIICQNIAVIHIAFSHVQLEHVAEFVGVN